MFGVRSIPALPSRLSTWLRVDRQVLTERVPVLLEQRLGRAAIEELIKAYQAGATRHELAKRYRIGRTSVYDLLRRYKIESRRKCRVPVHPNPKVEVASGRASLKFNNPSAAIRA